MPNIAQINDTQVSIINFKSIPVVTTAMLAEFYGTDVNNIQQNYLRNTERFVDGKHFFKLEGIELKAFKQLTDSKTVSKNTRTLTLWTERGAARHAKMLDTDQAWDIFEQLEDCYFHRQEILAKTHKLERTPLHDAHAMLVAKTKHLNSSDAWKIINQRFGTQSINEIPYDAIPVAVEYVHHLIALYSNAEKNQLSEDKLQNIYALATHVIWIHEWWREFGDAFKILNPTIYKRVTHRFSDGSCLAWRFLNPEQKCELEKCIDSFDWFTATYQQKLPI